MNDDNIYVGKLGKTVGLQGHLRLILDTDFPEQFKKDSIFITNRDISLKISHYNFLRQLVKFENYDDVDTAKRLINQEIYTTISQTKANCKLKENQFFWFDLISCEVFENDLNLGSVRNINRYPLNDYLEISTNSGLIAKNNLPKTFLIPFIFNEFILKVNLKYKRIDVKNSFAILENS